MTKKDKIILISSLLSGALLSVGIVTTIAVIKNKKQTPIPNIGSKEGNGQVKKDDNKKNDKLEDSNKIYDDEKELVNSDEIFPDISAKDYYDKLNFKDGQAWIDNDMIAFIISDIIKRMTITDGKIKYNYRIISNQNVEISFIWFNDKKKAYRTYKISTNIV